MDVAARPRFLQEGQERRRNPPSIVSAAQDAGRYDGLHLHRPPQPHDLHCELAGVDQKVLGSLSATNGNIHAPHGASNGDAGCSKKRKGTKGRRYRPASCPARMIMSLGNIHRAAKFLEREPLVATVLQAGESQCISLDFLRPQPQQHGSRQGRRITPHVEAFTKTKEYEGFITLGLMKSGVASLSEQEALTSSHRFRES